MNINQLKKKYKNAIIKIAPKTYQYNKELLQEAYSKNTIAVLAEVFGISKPTMTIRLKEAGIDIKKRGWNGGAKPKITFK